MRRNNTAGFSLLEVLATLVVTMLLVVSLTPFVSQMLVNWARGTEAVDTVELWSRGLRLLRSDLRHAIVGTGYGRLNDLLTFRGNETSMSFLVAAEGRGTYGLEMISISVAGNKSRWSLVRVRAPVVGSTYTAFSDPIVLASGRYKYLLRYYDRNGRVTPNWEDRLDLPSRVALDIEDGIGSPGRLLVEIPVFASVSAACFAAADLPGCPVALQIAQNLDSLKQAGINLGANW